MKPPIKAGKTPEAWDADALLAKARRYFEQMNDTDNGEWEHSLWSSLALEFVMRGTLAAISPALLADTGDRKCASLVSALGFIPNEPKFSPKSIGVAEVATRLGALLPVFTKELEDFCRTHSGKRNAELHSGENPFDSENGSTWHPLYYRACDALLSSMGLALKDFIGNAEAANAKKLTDAAADKAASAVHDDIKAHNKVWVSKTQNDRNKLFAAAEVWAARSLGHRVECPACKSTGLVIGEPVAPPQQTIKDDVIIATQEHLPSRFACKACELKIVGLSKLHAAKLDARYKKTTRYDAAEYYAPREDDEAGYYEDDNNE